MSDKSQCPRTIDFSLRCILCRSGSRRVAYYCEQCNRSFCNFHQGVHLCVSPKRIAT